MTHDSDQEPADHDPVADLAAWLRTASSEWPMLDDQAMTAEQMMQLTDQIIAAESRRGEPSIRPPADEVRRRRRRRLGVAMVPIVAAALAAAGWAALQKDATQATSFACIAPDVVVGIPNDGSPPLEVCHDVWEQGHIVPGVTEAPPLVACVDGHGVVAIIERQGHDSCADRDWVTWTGQAAYEAIGEAITAVRIDLHDRFQATGNGCATITDWRTGLADEPGADGWLIEVENDDPEAKCYDIHTVDPTSRRIALYATRDVHSIGCDPRTGC